MVELPSNQRADGVRHQEVGPGLVRRREQVGEIGGGRLGGQSRSPPLLQPRPARS